jgi:rhamnosyltransferase
VIVIDSGSTDGTLEILDKYPFIRLYQIPPEEFSHGGTRNYGVSLAKGEFVVMTVQDAFLENNSVMENAIKHFQDENIQAVAGRQAVPKHNEKNPHQWYRPINKPKVEYFQFKNPLQYEQLTPEQKRWVCGLDNVLAFYRKAALIALPFQKCDFGEDLLWANDAYSKGFVIILDPNLKTWHYHSQNYHYTYKVSIICAYNDWKIFGLLPQFSFKLKDIMLILYRNIKYKAHPKWIVYNLIINYASYKAQKKMANEINRSIKAAEELFKKHIVIIPLGRQ